MNAIDTNVLVRVLVKDDEMQSKKALHFIEKEGEVFVSAVVIAETVWVLEACYNIEKLELIKIVQNILMTSEFIVEHSTAIWLALDNYSNTNIDFTDGLIGAIAKSQDSEFVATFDKKASKSMLFRLIS